MRRILHWMGHLLKRQEVQKSVFREESRHISMRSNNAEWQTDWVGRGMGVSRRYTQMCKSFWLLCQRESEKILSLRKFYPQNQRKIQRHCDATSCGEPLCSNPYLRHWGCSCGKSRWAPAITSCVQFALLKNIPLPLVGECIGITIVSQSPYMGTTCAKETQQFPE